MKEGHGGCGDQHCWMPESILVPNGGETVDIAPTLVDNNDPYGCLRTRQDSLRIIFSKDSYPPVWDQRRIIEDAIIQAAAETNNPLIRSNTEYVRGGKPHHVSILGCKFSVAYRPGKKQKDAHLADGKAEPQNLGKKNGNSCDGRKKSRRTLTSKLPPEQICRFHIRLALYPGEFWCIEPWTGNRRHRNHPRLGWDGMRRPVDSLNLYEHCKSNYEYCCALAEKVDGVEAVIRKSIADLITKVKAMEVAQTSKLNDLDAPIASSDLSVDRREKCVHETHPSEPNQKRIKGAKQRTNHQDSFLM